MTMKKMKNFGRFSILMMLLVLAAVAQSFTSKPTDFIIIPANTTVSLESTESASSEDISEGHPVDFKVRANVTVNGVVVISAGAYAIGVVKKVIKHDKSCTNCQSGCAMIQIVVENVIAVNGSEVRLRSLPLEIKAPNPNCAAELRIGKTTTGQVLQNTKLQL